MISSASGHIYWMVVLSSVDSTGLLVVLVAIWPYKQNGYAIFSKELKLI